jgi:diazepam-binding inhibitor (GABA receptor modulating acyl-CoA-binding protein)
MEKAEAFKAATETAQAFTKRPSNEELLQLYALYKQATEGDIQGERPVGFDFKAIAKYDAWKSLSGLTNTQATDNYISLVNKLKESYV